MLQRRWGGNPTRWGVLWLPVLAALLVIFFAAAAATVGPIALVPLAAMLLLLLGLTKPAVLALMVVACIIIAPTLENITDLPRISLLDEVAVGLAALCFPLFRVLEHERLRSFPGQRMFAAFVVLGLLSGLVSDVPTRVLISGALLATKGVLFGWSIAQLDIKVAQLRRSAIIGGCVVSVVVVACLANLVAPTAWQGMIGDPAYYEARVRFGVPALFGPFVHPAALGRFMGIAAVVIVAYRACVGRSAATLLLLLASVGASVLSLRRKTLAALVVAVALIQRRAARLRTVLVIFMLLPLFVVVLGDQVAALFASTYDDYVAGPAARTRLTLDSFGLALREFPLGVGFGRFGSSVARDSYSPEYVDLGYANYYGMGPGEAGIFLTDTQWPAILAETGFFGCLSFAIAIYLCYESALHCYRGQASPWIRFIGLASMGVIAFMLVESVAAPVFTSAPTYPLLFGLIGLTVAVRELGHCSPPHGEATEARAVGAT